MVNPNLFYSKITYIQLIKKGFLSPFIASTTHFLKTTFSPSVFPHTRLVLLYYNLQYWSQAITKTRLFIVSI